MSAALDRFADLLRGAGQKVILCRDAFKFTCPLHNDRSPSADAKAGDKVPVVTFCQVCGNGVTLVDMLEELNASDVDRDLILGKPSWNGDDTIETVHHDYRDADGKPVLRVVRHLLRGKTKKVQRQYHHAGFWCWPKDMPESAIPDTRSLLYHVGDVPEALKRGDVVHVGEGERVVDALAALGLPATCNAGGASKDDQAPKWTRAHAEQLRGLKSAVVWEDNDGPGRAHGNAVAASLVAVGIADIRIVRFLDLPQKSDLVDWLAPIPKTERRHRVEALIAAAPRWGEDADTGSIPDRLLRVSLSGRAVLAHQFERPRSLLGQGIISVGDLVLVFGQAGMFKTWLMLMLGLAISDAKKWFGLETTSEPVPVGFVELELHGHAVQDRLRALIGDGGEIPDTFHLVVRPLLHGAFDLVDKNGTAIHLDELRAWIAERQLKVVFIDALARATSCPQVDFSPLLLALDVLRAETACAIVVIHHEGKPRKGDTGDDLDAMRGDSRLAGFPQSVLRVVKHHGTGCVRFAKVSCACTPEPIYFAKNESGVPEVTEAPEKASASKGAANRARVLDSVLKAERLVACREVAVLVGLSEATCRAHLAALVKDHQIARDGEDRNTRYGPPTRSPAEGAEQQELGGSTGPVHQ